MKTCNNLFQQIDDKYLVTLKHYNVKNQRVMIFLSGPPCSGKTTVAKLIEDMRKGLRLENDEIRSIAYSINPTASKQWLSEVAYRYMDYLRSKLLHESKNGLWVIDASIDSSYEKHEEFAEVHNFKTVLIAFRTPIGLRKTWAEDIEERKPFTTKSTYLGLFKSRENAQNLFLSTHQPDIVISPNKPISHYMAKIDKLIIGL